MATDVTARAPQGTKNAVDASLNIIGEMISPKFRKAGVKAVAQRLNEVASGLEPEDGLADLINDLAASIGNIQAALHRMSGNGGSAALALEKARADMAEARLVALLNLSPSPSALAPAPAVPVKTRKPRGSSATNGSSAQKLSPTRAVPKAGLTKNGKKRGRPFTKNMPPPTPTPHSNGELTYQASGEMEAEPAAPYHATEHTED